MKRCHQYFLCKPLLLDWSLPRSSQEVQSTQAEYNEVIAYSKEMVINIYVEEREYKIDHSLRTSQHIP